jgi:hypothetical protein
MGGNVLRSLAGVATLGLSEALYFGPQSQAQAAKDASNAQRKAELDARRIAASQKPLEESATLGLNTGMDDTLTSLGLMTTPDEEKLKSRKYGLGTSSSGTGLGTSMSGTLGLGS